MKRWLAESAFGFFLIVLGMLIATLVVVLAVMPNA